MGAAALAWLGLAFPRKENELKATVFFFFYGMVLLVLLRSNSW